MTTEELNQAEGYIASLSTVLGVDPVTIVWKLRDSHIGHKDAADLVSVLRAGNRAGRSRIDDAIRMQGKVLP